MSAAQVCVGVQRAVRDRNVPVGHVPYQVGVVHVLQGGVAVRVRIADDVPPLAQDVPYPIAVVVVLVVRGEYVLVPHTDERHGAARHDEVTPRILQFAPAVDVTVGVHGQIRMRRPGPLQLPPHDIQHRGRVRDVVVRD